jgi:hypothetical protein
MPSQSVLEARQNEAPLHLPSESPLLSTFHRPSGNGGPGSGKEAKETRSRGRKRLHCAPRATGQQSSTAGCQRRLANVRATARLTMHRLSTGASQRANKRSGSQLRLRV